jgi:nicotinamidase-related amidase
MSSAVLVIDVQMGLFEGKERPFEADQVIQKINNITNTARTSDVTVIFIQHQQEKGLLVKGSKDWELHHNLEIKESDFIIQKTTPDSFLRTNLDETLSKKGIKNVIICGYASEFCVDTTTRRAAALGYSVSLAGDAHTTHDKAHASAKTIREHHNATLPDLTSFGPKISVVRSADLSFEG